MKVRSFYLLDPLNIFVSCELFELTNLACNAKRKEMDASVCSNAYGNKHEVSTFHLLQRWLFSVDVGARHNLWLPRVFRLSQTFRPGQGKQSSGRFRWLRWT